MQTLESLYIYSFKDNCQLFKVFKTEEKPYWSEKNNFYWITLNNKNKVRVNYLHLNKSGGFY